ncbi:type IV secretion system protein [Roseateles sp. LYH14W]|uniref:Type IV secretion system protein n=1 Tax=Pelomonas parva TaxID=3299032 RepID=A0ABW7F8Q4_9BURK
MHTRLKVAAAAAILAITGTARATGIPVIDVANLVQTVQQVMNDITEITNQVQQINNQVQQINQLRSQLTSINGVRNLGKVFHDLALTNYVPAEVYTLFNDVNSSGYSGLNATAKALRDANMIYNCADRSSSDRTACQAALAQPFQHKGLLQDAMKAAAGRLSQIQSLMGQINATNDQKSVQEIQARIGAENALLAHEVSQVQMLQGMADSEERIARAQDRERQYQMLARTGKVSDYLP